MNKIIVKLNFDDYPKDYNYNTQHYDMWILGELRKAGIPVKGIFKFLGVENGVLHRVDDPANIGRISYLWIP